MDAIDILTGDHGKLVRLLDDVRRERDFKTRVARLRQFGAEFLAHAILEESVFYPPFARHDDLKPRIDEFQAAHRAIREMLEELKFFHGSAETLENLVARISSATTALLREEQDVLFPAAKRIMHRPERDQLGRHLEAARAKKAAA